MWIASQMSALPGWRSEMGRLRYVAAYQRALYLWEAPVEDLEIPARFGTTHALASGERMPGRCFSYTLRSTQVLSSYVVPEVGHGDEGYDSGTRRASQDLPIK